MAQLAHGWGRDDLADISGIHWGGVLAALVNAASLVLIAVIIFDYHAGHFLHHASGRIAEAQIGEVGYGAVAAMRKRSMRHERMRLFGAIFLTAVAFNFCWEIGQSPLFAPMGGWLSGMWRCFVASFGDGVIVATIAAAGSLLFRSVDWCVRPGPAGYTFTGACSVLVAMAIEIGARATGRWSYSDQMPLIPFVQVLRLSTKSGPPVIPKFGPPAVDGRSFLLSLRTR